MVFQKRNAAKGKQQTPAKPKNKKAEVAMDAFFEGGSDDSESEEEVVKKTPGKTPKGKQNQGDKRVSFQIPGKNTPNKTPKGENLVSKKQATPGKTNLKEFKGLLANDSAKKNGKQSKKQVDSDDDDDDSEDDDDDEDMDEDDDEDADLDMLLGGGGEDDDDDDDEEEDDDDDDDDEDEDDDSNKQLSQKKKQSVSGQISSPSKKEQSFTQNKTPMKNSDNVVTKVEKTPKDKTPKKQEKNIEKSSEKQSAKNVQTQKGAQTPQKNASPSKFEKKDDKAYQAVHKLAEERIRDRDSRTLFVGSIPLDVTATELKALSSDILNVSIPQAKFKRNRKFQFAFLEFASQDKAEENYKILQSKKLRGQPFKVDFTGQKSKHSNPSDQQKKENLKKLFITSLPLDATIDKVASFFPKAFQINVNTNPVYRCASVNFVTEEDAAEALTDSKDFKINGLPLTVVYSVSGDLKNKKRKRKPKKGKNQNQPQKKMKVEIKEESDDDDNDDDDDDEE